MTKERAGDTGAGEPRAGSAPRCLWCHRPVVRESIGRPRMYCRQSCRQRAYEARRRADELGLSDDELVVARNELDDVNDRLAEVLDAVEAARIDDDDGVAPGVVLERMIASLSSILEQNR